MSKNNNETKAVFDHHLAAFAQGIDAILDDYTENSVIITPDEEFHGLIQIRSFFESFLGGTDTAFWASFRIHKQRVEGEVAYLVWSATPTVVLATDTLLVKDQKISVQTFTPVYS